MSENRYRQSIAIVGGGPAGLMAAEVLTAAGHAVDLFEAKPSPGRKFLMAGKGGLNITHAEPHADFLVRYGNRADWFAPLLEGFGAETLRAWMLGLGIASFVGSSGRVFPSDMKAAPLLRAWLHRLRTQGLRIHTRHRWLGWNAQGALRMATPEGEIAVKPAATILALGGASWPQLGSDAAWVPWLAARSITIAPWRAANCGFDVAWSEHFRTRFAGEAVKTVIASCVGTDGRPWQRRGEFTISAHGIEGSLVYALSAPLRDTLHEQGSVVLELDLLPDRDPDWVAAGTAHPRGARSLSSHLQSRLGLRGVKAGLLRECLPAQTLHDPAGLARAIKALPLRLLAPRPIAEAISCAGGICLEELDANLMLRQCPGVFCAGEMLDWEAPTGGYLLTGCLSSGYAAGQGAVTWLAGQ